MAFSCLAKTPSPPRAEYYRAHNRRASFSFHAKASNEGQGQDAITDVMAGLDTAFQTKWRFRRPRFEP
jgi:hypothetical protein